MTLAPRSLIVAETTTSRRSRKARNMFTISEIEGRIRTTEHLLRQYMMNHAEEVAAGNGSDYWSGRVAETERNLAYWKNELASQAVTA